MTERVLEFLGIRAFLKSTKKLVFICLDSFCRDISELSGDNCSEKRNYLLKISEIVIFRLLIYFINEKLQWPTKRYLIFNLITPNVCAIQKLTLFHHIFYCKCHNYLDFLRMYLINFAVIIKSKKLASKLHIYDGNTNFCFYTMEFLLG